MSSIAYSAVRIQTSAESLPSMPSWFGEVALIAHHLTRLGLLDGMGQRVQFARPRFGQYEVIDFVGVLIGYAVSGEPTLQAFYERLWPFATPFMALFGRTLLPHRSTLSRFLSALDQAPVEALRALFGQDLLARAPLGETVGGLWDRQGGYWLVFDVDGTRQAARQRALPQTPDLPCAKRRMARVCAAGYQGRKRGEVVRTRTTVLQAHTHQWLGTFSGTGNGDYRGELLRATEAIAAYLAHQQIPLTHGVVRLDGQYGNAAIVVDLRGMGLGSVMRSRDYHLLDLPQVQARLAEPADQHITSPESGTQRSLFDCPDVPLFPGGAKVRLIVATHPATGTKAAIGVTRGEVVYELFFTTLPQGAFTPADVLALYLHRGSFEIVLSDEDREQDPDRWVSHSPWGQECWQIINQWMWNLRLELGHQLHPTPMRTTQFAPPLLQPTCQEALTHGPAVLQPMCQETLTHDPAAPQWARAKRPGGIGGEDFTLQEDGTLRCPAGQVLCAQERRPEAGGTLRVFYAAGIGSCRPCPLRERCQGRGAHTKKPRRVSMVLRPIAHTAPDPSLPPPPPGPHPLLWGDWSRCQTRRAWMRLLRTQTVTLTCLPLAATTQAAASGPLTRAQRAHWRLSWNERLARNACSTDSPAMEIHLFGIPPALAAHLSLPSR